MEDGEVFIGNSTSKGGTDTDTTHEPVAKLNPIYSNSFFTKRYVSIKTQDDHQNKDHENKGKDGTEKESKQGILLTNNNNADTQVTSCLNSLVSLTHYQTSEIELIENKYQQLSTYSL